MKAEAIHSDIYVLHLLQYEGIGELWGFTVYYGFSICTVYSYSTVYSMQCYSQAEPLQCYDEAVTQTSTNNKTSKHRSVCNFGVSTKYVQLYIQLLCNI